VVVGSPEEVADELIAWVEETDVDGFNLAYAATPETFADFVDLVVPELQRRGRYKLDYARGTLREKLYGPGRARLGADHPAARFRGLADRSGSR
jgi:alkanesulfonate monooxygenase